MCSLLTAALEGGPSREASGAGTPAAAGLQKLQGAFKNETVCAKFAEQI